MSELVEKAVRLPVCGSITVYVELPDGATDREYIDAAHEQQDWRIETGPNTSADGEFSALEHVCTGNVCHAPFWDVEVEES
jgi:hypothetical protein